MTSRQSVDLYLLITSSHALFFFSLVKTVPENFPLTFGKFSSMELTIPILSSLDQFSAFNFFFFSSILSSDRCALSRPRALFTLVTSFRANRGRIFYLHNREYLRIRTYANLLTQALVKRTYEFRTIFVRKHLRKKKFVNLRSLVKWSPGEGYWKTCFQANCTFIVLFFFKIKEKTFSYNCDSI